MSFPCHNCFYNVEEQNEKTSNPCGGCSGGSRRLDVYEYANRLRSTLAAHQLDAGTQGYRQQRALAPILAHADAHEFAPPLKFSRDRCREIREEVERDR